jgi:hypothetical protein
VGAAVACSASRWGAGELIATQFENSEVLPAGFVTVTVSHLPVVTSPGTVANPPMATVPPPSVTCAPDPK